MKRYRTKLIDPNWMLQNSNDIMSVRSLLPPKTHETYQWIDHGTYWELKAPQGDDIWLKGRMGRITTSVSGAMANRSKFKTAEEQGQIIAGVVEEKFTAAELERMGHGTDTEPEARNWFGTTIPNPITERGLIVPKWDPTLGASVDGDIIGTDGIIEIKCPVSMYYPLEQYMDQRSIGWVPRADYFKHIWSTHYDQMQHAMAVMGKKYCIYIVYCTTESKVFTQKIDFDPVYWENHYRVIKENYKKYIEPYLDGRYPIMPPGC